MAECRGAGEPQPGAGRKKLKERVQGIYRVQFVCGYRKNDLLDIWWTWLPFLMSVQYQGTVAMFQLKV